MKKSLFALSSLTLLLASCGGSSKTTLTPDFSLAAAPSAITLTNGGPGQTITVGATPLNSFTGSISVALSGLPTGVTASPATLSLTPGQLGQVTLTASGAAVASALTVTATGTSGTLSHTATAALSVKAGVSTATLSNLSFDFGADLVGTAVTKSVVTVTNSGASDVTLSPAITGDAAYALVAAQSCGATLTAGSTCSEYVSYTPTAASSAGGQTATLNLGLGNVDSGTPQSVSLSGTSAVLTAGTVTKTNNPQVALYSVTLPFPGSVTVNFGPDTTYGKSTWSQSTAEAGGTVNMLVAGMLPNTTYHMQAVVQLANGATATDSDHTFTTKDSPLHPTIAVTTTPGMNPQPGVELLTFVAGGVNGVAVTDLQGRVLWTYQTPLGQELDAVKMLPNGHFLITIAHISSFDLTNPTPPPNNLVVVREIDLAGNIVRELSAADLNVELQAAGYNLTLLEFHHDIVPLPNGHWLILSNVLKNFANLPGVTGPVNVLGDVVVDVDENLHPVWVWNEFDHFDVNRRPMGFPDWTHSNALVYSPSDGNILISMRHQNWVVKVAYHDGAGNGDVLWKLGQGGDLTLVGGSDPIDWNYAQHYPSFFSNNTSGIFSLGLMDNGNDRPGCVPSAQLSCPYSTIPVFKIDEGAKTATLTFHQILPPNLYTFFGGTVELLPNGNIAYMLSGVLSGSESFEVTPTATPQTVWHMGITNAKAYRGSRIPSLYPDVQW